MDGKPMHICMSCIIVPYMGMNGFFEGTLKKCMRGTIVNAQKCVAKFEIIHAYERKWYMWGNCGVAKNYIKRTTREL